MDMPPSAAFNSANSEGLKEIEVAATFSSKWVALVVPGMGTIHGFWALNHASDS